MARDITERTLLKIDEQERTKRNGNKEKTVLRVVQWNESRPMLEKRDFWRDGQEWKSGKAKGMNINDLHLIADNWEEIAELLEGEEEERPRRSSKKRSSSVTKKKKKNNRKRPAVVSKDDDEDIDSDSDNDGYDDDDDFDDYDD